MRQKVSRPVAAAPKVSACRRDPDWVSKTNMRDYASCPYGFWLLDNGQVRREDIFSQFDQQLIAEGTAHEDGLLAEMPVLPPGLSEAHTRKLTRYVYSGPVIENAERKLLGRPDGIDLEAHAPIEIKSHLRMRPMDRYELAFYWLLLEPSRQNAEPSPYGLFQGLIGDLVRVELGRRDFEYVDRMIAGVREARKMGVQPAVCDCIICWNRPEINKLRKQGRDVRLVWGVGPVHAGHLRRNGVATIQDLAAADSVALAGRLRNDCPGRAISASRIVGWQHHARAMRDKKPVRFGAITFEHENCIALDLEYELGGGGDIWLIGACVKRNGALETFQVFCHRKDVLKRGLFRLHELLKENRDLPIITWNGDGADLPQLAAAARTHRIPVMQTIRKRHVDLLGVSRRSIRLPIPTFELKAVTAYLGVRRKSGITHGLQALEYFNRYRNTRSKDQRARLRQKLLAYNREDLEALPIVAEFLRTT